MGLLLPLLSLLALPCHGSSEMDGLGFLDIPVGGRPAAMGGAYSALADDAYAVNLNAGGLGFLKSAQFSGQHSSYMDSIHHEYASFVAPLRGAGVSVGASVQYLGTDEIAAVDEDGNPLGGFSSRFAAYNLSLGRAITRRLSLGLTGKWINAEIDGESANAYAADIGTMYRARRDLTLSAVVSNWGSQLTFLEEGDPLPTAYHLGAAYHPGNRWTFSAEGVSRRDNPASLHLGVECRPLEMFSLRASYRTDSAETLGTMAGFTAGLGLVMNKYDFSYAWVPLGEFGNAHYFSVGFRFDAPAQTRRNK